MFHKFTFVLDYFRGLECRTIVGTSRLEASRNFVPCDTVTFRSKLFDRRESAVESNFF